MEEEEGTGEASERHDGGSYLAALLDETGAAGLERKASDGPHSTERARERREYTNATVYIYMYNYTRRPADFVYKRLLR